MSGDVADARAADVGAAWSGSGFSAFFGKHYERLLRATYLVVGSRAAAEDITQDAFVVAWRKWDRIAGYERPDLWVTRVAIRMAIRHVSRARLIARDTRDNDLVLTAEPGADGELLAKVAGLPPAQRAAIVLFYYEDRPVEQVAEIIGCATATARVHLHRARTRLKVMIEQEAG